MNRSNILDNKKDKEKSENELFSRYLITTDVFNTSVKVVRGIKDISPYNLNIDVLNTETTQVDKYNNGYTSTKPTPVPPPITKQGKAEMAKLQANENTLNKAIATANANIAKQQQQVSQAEAQQTQSRRKLQTAKTALTNAQQAEQQAAQQAQQMQMQMEQEKEAREDARNLQDNETKIKVALINAEAKMVDADENNDGYVDRTEATRAAQEVSDNAKMQMEREKMTAELGLKREEMQEKKRANKAEEAIKRTAANKKSNA